MSGQYSSFMSLATALFLTQLCAGSVSDHGGVWGLLRKQTFINDNQAEGVQGDESMCGGIKEDLICRDDDLDVLQDASPDKRVGPGFHIVGARDESAYHTGVLELENVELLCGQRYCGGQEPDHLRSVSKDMGMWYG